MWVFYLTIASKLLIGLLSIVVVINLTGKGNLAPASAMDQVQNYVLGGIIGGVIYNPNITVVQYMIILMIWMFLVLGLRFLKVNSLFFKRVLDGNPVVLIKRGVLDVEACRKAGFSAYDVMFKLRSNGVYSVQKVRRAVLEQNGQLIIVLFGEEVPKYPIITDGIIRYDILDSMDKDEEWLREKIQQKGYQDVAEIFLAEMDGGDIYLVPYVPKEE